MSVFSECFNEIKDKRELTIAQIAEISGKDRSLIFYWSTGKHLPENWQQIEETVCNLQLSWKERKKLQESYEKVKIGENKYRSFYEIGEILSGLSQKNKEKMHTIPGKMVFVEREIIPEFLVLDNKIEILYWIQRILELLMLEDEKEVYLKLTENVTEILVLINCLCRQLENCKIQKIIRVTDEQGTYQSNNIKLLRKVIEVFEQKSSIQIYTYKQQQNGEDFDTNWIISDKIMIQFDSKLSDGLLISDSKWIEFYKNLFTSTTEQSRRFGKKKCSVEEFIDVSVVPNNGNSIEYMPHIGHDLTREILERHIYDDIPNRERNMQGLLENILCGEDETFKWNSFFWEEGLIAFMESGRVENVPYSVYSPLELHECCSILETTIALAQNKLYTYHMVKSDELKPMKGIYLGERIINESNSLIINWMLGGEIVEQIEVNDKNVSGVFSEYFEYLKEYEKVYNEEETIARMEAILERYRLQLIGNGVTFRG